VNGQRCLLKSMEARTTNSRKVNLHENAAAFAPNSYESSKILFVLPLLYGQLTVVEPWEGGPTPKL